MSNQTKTTPPSFKNLTKKILAVIADIEPIKKDGVNSFHNYKYVSDAQIVEMIRALLIKHKLVILPSQLECSQENNLTVVKVNYKIIDAESGEFLDTTAFGYGMDKGDKGVYKASTGAEKYFFLKTFLVPTFDDAEKESPVRREPIATKVDRFIKENPIEENSFNDSWEEPNEYYPTKSGRLFNPTEKQLKRLYAITMANNWTSEQVKLYMSSKWRINSSKELNISQYDELCNLIQKKSANQAIKEIENEVIDRTVKKHEEEEK